MKRNKAAEVQSREEAVARLRAPVVLRHDAILEASFINTGTTVVTFLVVFLIQNTQKRDVDPELPTIRHGLNCEALRARTGVRVLLPRHGRGYFICPITVQ
jgi:low affinity iron permease